MQIKIIKPDAEIVKAQCPANGDWDDAYKKSDTVDLSIWELIMWAVSMWRLAPNKNRLHYELDKFVTYSQQEVKHG